MIIAPLWVFLVLFAIAGAVKLIYGPRWKRAAAERRRMFEERKNAPREESTDER